MSESSCGLCGLESLAQLLRPLPFITSRIDVTRAALFTAIATLRYVQPLNAETGAARGAAFYSPDGDIVMASENVGRHNALDKLIGALAKARIRPAAGFLLLTTRCSNELLERRTVEMFDAFRAMKAYWR